MNRKCISRGKRNRAAPKLAELTAQAFVVDTPQLAKLLDVSERHIERMDAAGKLPAALRIGKSKRWLLDGGPNGIRQWLAAGCPARNGKS